MSKEEDLSIVKELLRSIKEMLGVEKEINSTVEERANFRAKREDLARKELLDVQKQAELVKEIAERENDFKSINQANLAIAQEKANLAKIQLQQAAENRDVTAEQLMAARDAFELAEKELQTQQKIAAAVEDVRSSTSSTLKGLLGSVDASETFAGKMFQASKGAGGIGAAISQVGKGLQDATKPADLMAGLMAKVQEATFAGVLQFDSLRAELTKGGASLEMYGDQIDQVRDSSVTAGVGIEQAGEAFLGLHKNMSAFSMMSKASQTQLAQQTAIMGKLGVSTEATAESMNTLAKGLGMTASEITHTNLQIAATANALGVSVAQAMEDFSASLPTLVAHGRDSIQVFRELQTQSKATGMAIGDLLGLVSTFDTFQGASEATAMLNATMGTTLNSIELLNASESERISLLKESLEATGRSFESMSRFERIQAAQVLTGGDVNKLQKLMTANLNSTASAAQKAAMAQEELKKKAADATTEKFAILMERFGVALNPLVDILHTFADGLLSINQYLGDGFIPAVALAMIGVSVLARGIGALTTIKTFFATVLGASTAATTTDTAAQELNNKAKGRAGTIAKASAKSMLAFAGAVALIGAGIGIAAMGMAQFVKAFSGMNADQILAVSLAIAAFGITMGVLAYLMTTVGAAAVIPMLAFGAAFLMIGGGVFLAAAGISLMVTALGKLFEILIPNIDAIPKLALGIGALTLSLYGLSSTFLVLVPVMAVLSALTVGVTALAAALALIKTEDLQAVAALGAGIGNMTIESAVAFGNAMMETKNTVEAIAREPEAAGTLQQTVTAFSPALTAGPAPAAPAPTAAAPAAASTTAGGSMRQINIYIDGKKMAKCNVDLNEKYYGLNSFVER